MIEKSEIVPQFPERLTATKTEFPKIEYEYNSLIEQLQKSKDPKTIEILWWVLSKSPKLISIIYHLITFFEAIMNNDKKATILGMAKSTLIILGTLFFSDKVAQVTGLSEAIVVVAASVWGLAESIQGWITNKPETKKP